VANRGPRSVGRLAGERGIMAIGLGSTGVAVAQYTVLALARANGNYELQLARAAA
jgi:hypothetical protein